MAYGVLTPLGSSVPGLTLSPSTGAAVSIATDANTIPLTVRAAASQAVDIFEVQNSASTVLFSIDKNGVLQVLKNAGQGIVVGGNLDGNDADSTQRNRISLACGTANGINARAGGVGDSITSDNANGGGASYFNPLYLNNTFATNGSFQGMWNQLQVNEGASNDLYAEGVAHFITVTGNRRGALVEAVEAGVTVNAGKPARASVLTALISENNALADYTTYLGAGSRWAETGAMGIWVGSNATFPAGTGLFIEALNGAAGFDHAVRIKLASGSQIPLGSKVIGDTNERMILKSDGLEFGPGSGATDVIFQRTGTKILRVQGSLTLDAFSGTGSIRANQVAGDVVIRNNLLSADANNAWKVFGNGDSWYGAGGGSAVDTMMGRLTANVLGLGTDDSFRTGLNATGSRPSASSVGNGSQFYDTTLHKPIWSDGTNWRDASATVV